jgi:hypothetical protein
MKSESRTAGTMPMTSTLSPGWMSPPASAVVPGALFACSPAAAAGRRSLAKVIRCPSASPSGQSFFASGSSMIATAGPRGWVDSASLKVRPRSSGTPTVLK